MDHGRSGGGGVEREGGEWVRVWDGVWHVVSLVLGHIVCIRSIGCGTLFTRSTVYQCVLSTYLFSHLKSPS